MKLYHISQTEKRGYDVYDSAVVCAENARDASKIHPYGDWGASNWCDRYEDVKVRLLGEAVLGIPEGIVCSSFNAG